VEIRTILEPLFDDSERRALIEANLQEIRKDKTKFATLANRFLDLITLKILKSAKDDGPLGKLANPVPASFHADLWGTAFGDVDDSLAGGSQVIGDEGNVTVSTQTSTRNHPPETPTLMLWAQYRQHSLLGTSDFVEAYHEAIWATYESLNIEVSLGTDIASVSLSGFVPKIRDWAHRRDLLAI
jgi:hypothetical protein